MLQVHDEIVVHCHEDELDATCTALKHVMEEPFLVNGRQVKLEAEIKYGRNWGQTQEWKS